MGSMSRVCQSKYVEAARCLLVTDYRYVRCPQAAADKIIREIEMFGEDFSGFNAQEEAIHPHPHPAPTAAEDDPDRATTQGASSAPTTDASVSSAQQSEGARVDKAKKGKVAAKSTGLQYQFQIMQSIGVPREEIKKFADPYYWLEYFPPICIVRAASSRPSAHYSYVI